MRARSVASSDYVHAERYVRDWLGSYVAGTAAPTGYVLGGYGDTVDWRPRAEVFELDPAAYTWTSKAPMPTPRGALAAAFIDDRIYAVAGVAPDGLSGALEVFDPEHAVLNQAVCVSNRERVAAKLAVRVSGS